MNTSTLEDFSQALKNIGGKEGVELSVSLDKKTMNHFTILGIVLTLTAVGLVALIKK